MSYNPIRHPEGSAKALEALRKAEEKRERRAAKRREEAKKREAKP